MKKLQVQDDGTHRPGGYDEASGDRLEARTRRARDRSTGRGSAGAGSGRVRNSDHERFDRRQNITSPGVKKLQVQDDASEREPLSWV